MDLREIGLVGVIQTGLIWFMAVTSGGLVKTVYVFGFHKMLENSSVAAQLGAP
jgi:hypothetical protein